MKENTIKHQEWIIRFDGSIKHKKITVKQKEKFIKKEIT